MVLAIMSRAVMPANGPLKSAAAALARAPDGSWPLPAPAITYGTLASARRPAGQRFPILLKIPPGEPTAASRAIPSCVGSEPSGSVTSVIVRQPSFNSGTAECPNEAWDLVRREIGGKREA